LDTINITAAAKANVGVAQKKSLLWCLKTEHFVWSYQREPFISDV